MKINIVVFIALLSVAACKKTDSVKDCQTNNYGIVHINFGATATRHDITVTQSGTTNFRDKIVAIGTASDTLHLSPATWILSIASIDNGGLAISSDTKTAITTQCSDETFTVSF